MSYISSIFLEFNEYAKLNPIIAGVISVWALSTITFFCRGIPKTIYEFIIDQSTTTLTFSNAGYGYSVENFASFLIWFENHKWSKYARALSMDNSYGVCKDSVGKDKAMVTGVGNGYHLFVYNKRLFILRRYDEPKAGTDKLIHIVKLTMFSRNRQILLDLIEEFSYKIPTNKTGMSTFVATKMEWVSCGSTNQRPIETVIVDSRIKNSILKIVDDFRNSRDWYTKRGLAYKKTFVLHGIHGTGKSSFIKALACHYKMGLCIINISDMSNATFEFALNNVPDNNLVLIEDFDSAKATKQRGTESKGLDGIFDESRSLSLTGILNTLDGVASLDNKLIFMTTNVIDTLDAALLRKGRIDYIYELKALTDKEIKEYINLMFPDNLYSTEIVFEDILGCDIQGLYFDHKDNFTDFIKSIPQKEKK